MTPTFYKTYVVDLRRRLDDLIANEEAFQVFDLTFELSISRVLMVGKMARRKAQTDKLFYATDLASGSRTMVSDETATAALRRFTDFGQFVALNGAPAGTKAGDILTVGGKYPMCAIDFSYRKKGQPKAVSMKMIFIGVNDDADALEYAAGMADPGLIVGTTTLSTAKLWQWK